MRRYGTCVLSWRMQTCSYVLITLTLCVLLVLDNLFRSDKGFDKIDKHLNSIF